MARQARKKSQTGIYHLMMRGNNKDQIFFDEQDYKKFISILIQCKKISHFEMYAYCIMPNHVHLLLKETDEDISTIMKRIECRFVYWYNAKYHRIGLLFQDRFRSEPIETDEYFLCALKYIHYNPIKAGLAKNCSDYEYESYHWYFENGILIDKDFPLSLMSIHEFKKFHFQEDDTPSFIDVVESRHHITDEEAATLICEITKCQTPESFGALDKSVQKQYLKQLKEAGISIRQLTKLLNVTKRRAEKA